MESPNNRKFTNRTRAFHYPIIYNKPTRCNSGSIVFIKNYKYALHVSDAVCVHHQEHYKLYQQPLVFVIDLGWNKSCIDVKVGAHCVCTDLDTYTGFIPTQLMTNTSGCWYSL